MIKTPNYVFDDYDSVGINLVPKKGLIIITSGEFGNSEKYIKNSNAGNTAQTTIREFLVSGSFIRFENNIDCGNF